MAMVSLGTGVFYPIPANMMLQGNGTAAFAVLGAPVTEMNAVGEMVAMIGQVYFAAGPGTAKTISSAGGSIGFLTGTTGFTWATAGTTVRVGIQDVSATVGPPVQPDEVWTGEPQVDLVQGTDTLTATTWKTAALTSGSRTLTHGDLIAVVFEMTVRNGADLVSVSGMSITGMSHRPNLCHKIGAGWVQSAVQSPNAVITCDDGTLCTLAYSFPHSSATIRNPTSATTPDEYGNIIIPNFKCNVEGLWSTLSMVGEPEMKFYSDALNVTAPTTEQTILIDVNQVLSTSSRPIQILMPTEALTAGAAYAVTVRPTTASITAVVEVSVADASHFSLWPGGTGVYKCTRQDNAGAFTVTTTARMIMGVVISDVDDGTGAGSAGGSFTFVG